ncbi:hypothetical protein PSAKC1_00009 [Pseudomonas phage PSA-KC1]
MATKKSTAKKNTAAPVIGLAEIVAAGPNGLYTSPAVHGPLIEAGMVEINPAVTNEAGEIATRATQKGIDEMNQNTETGTAAASRPGRYFLRHRRQRTHADRQRSRSRRQRLPVRRAGSRPKLLRSEQRRQAERREVACFDRFQRNRPFRRAFRRRRDQDQQEGRNRARHGRNPQVRCSFGRRRRARLAYQVSNGAGYGPPYAYASTETPAIVSGFSFAFLVNLC